MANKKDASGFTPQERHQIIVDYLKEINKPTKVFHLRWKPGDLLDGKVLETTPMFWYMKYRWSRQEIETMFYKARCVIGPTFDMALQQTFGGDPGPRWRGAIPEPPKQKWRTMQQEKMAGWQAEQNKKMAQKLEEERIRKFEQAKRLAEQEKQRKEEEKKLAGKSKDIWNAVSDFGADKSIDYKTFSENLQDRGINISRLLAKQLFDQLAGPNGTLTKQQMDELIKKCDAMKDASTITWDMFGDKLGCMTIMKRVLLAAGTSEPFNVDDFVFAQKVTFTIDTIQFMNKLMDRDVPWDDRIRAMEQLGANLGANPLFNNVLARGNIPELLCGWATQIIDNKPEVQKTAIDTLPGVFHNAMEFGDKDLAIGHLEEILDNLFKVLDDPKVSKNHPAAKDAINKLVQDVIDTGDPESILFIAGLIAEKTDMANTNSPEGRKVALQQLQRLMFAGSPYAQFADNKNEAPIVSHPDLPKKGTATREWLDIATNKQKGPSPAMMSGNLAYSQKGKKYPDNKREQRDEKKQPPQLGTDEDSFSLQDPIPVVTSTPSYAKPKQPVTFDASKSRDMDGDPCKKYVWDFGDGTKPVTTTTSTVKHPYEKPGPFPVKCTVIDKNGRKATAKLTQQVTDPKQPNKKYPPVANLVSDPPISRPKQPVTFDASKSHDMDSKPCVNFVWDFGDVPKKTTKEPTIKHSFPAPGVYPVSVTVTDKNGLSSKASLTQRVADPAVTDTDPSRGPRAPKKKNYGGQKRKGNPSTDPAGNTHPAKGGNKKPAMEEQKQPSGMEPQEIGNEFRSITYAAISNAILDHNADNNRDGKKLADVMRQLDPVFADELDPDAKRQYGKWSKKPLKPVKYAKPLPTKPELNPGVAQVHPVQMEVHMDVGTPVMPDL